MKLLTLLLVCFFFVVTIATELTATSSKKVSKKAKTSALAKKMKFRSKYMPGVGPRSVKDPYAESWIPIRRKVYFTPPSPVQEPLVYQTTNEPERILRHFPYEAEEDSETSRQSKLLPLMSSDMLHLRAISHPIPAMKSRYTKKEIVQN
eukprot:GILJ01021350.1.p1 GENE.GILJ01021350.1~~GILJ01021350.1.p1  ORF type:complete len:149 (+),score=20.63 GILJ01021350.1:1-447(+)